MEKGTHGTNEKSFEELSYADQAKSLNAQIQVVQKALKAHIRKGTSEDKNITDMKNKYKEQVLKVAKILG